MNHAANDSPALRPYLVKIGTRAVPRLEFGVMATSSAAAFMQHMDLAERGERVEIIAVGESFAVSAKRHQVAEAEMREVGRG